jgi:hypothetical protein
MLSYVIRPAFRMTCIRYLAALFTHPTVSYLSLTNLVGDGGNNCTGILLVPPDERGKWAHAPLGNGGVQVLRVLLANGHNRLGGRRKGPRVVSVYLCSFVAPMWWHHRHHIISWTIHWRWTVRIVRVAKDGACELLPGPRFPLTN